MSNPVRSKARLNTILFVHELLKLLFKRVIAAISFLALISVSRLERELAQLQANEQMSTNRYEMSLQSVLGAAQLQSGADSPLQAGGA